MTADTRRGELSFSAGLGLSSKGSDSALRMSCEGRKNLRRKGGGRGSGGEARRCLHGDRTPSEKGATLDLRSAPLGWRRKSTMRGNRVMDDQGPAFNLKDRAQRGGTFKEFLKEKHDSAESSEERGNRIDGQGKSIRQGIGGQ